MKRLNPHNLYISFLLASIYSASTFFCASSFADETVDLSSRGDVTQRILWMPGDRATASVILFAGGTGRIKITDDGEIKKGGNFLVRSRNKFTNHKLNVAVFDAPSDFYTGIGMKTENFRDSKMHATDIAAVITYIKEEGKCPRLACGYQSRY